MENMEKESAEVYGFPGDKFRIVEPKPVEARVPPPTDSSPNLLRGSIPAGLALQTDFAGENEYKGLPVYRLIPAQPTGQSAINSAAQSVSTHVTSTESAGVVAAGIAKALPGAVVGTGAKANINPASLSNVQDGPTYIRGTQQTGAINLVQNGNFEAEGNAIPPAGWSIQFGASVSYNTSNPQSGSQSVSINPNGTQFAGLIGNQTFACQPGDAFQVSAYILQSATSSGGIAQLLFFDQNDTLLGGVSTPGSGGGSGSWTFAQASGTAPANSVYAQIKIACGLTGVFDTISFDNVVAVRQLTAFDLTPTSTSFTIQNSTSPLSAASGGSANHAVITISSFVGVFGDGNISYNGGTVSGLLDNTNYVCFCIDPSYSGGAVTWQALPATAASPANASNGLIVAGAVATPVFGSPTITGTGGGSGGVTTARSTPKYA